MGRRIVENLSSRSQIFASAAKARQAASSPSAAAGACTVAEPHASPVTLQLDAGTPVWRGPAGPFDAVADRALPGFNSAAATSVAPPPPDSLLQAHCGRGWIADVEREFVLECHRTHCALRFDRGAVAWSNTGDAIWLPAPIDDSRLAVELTLGIGMVAALAARRVFCLHAGALLWRDGALAIVGSSGAGKSTFVRAVHGAGRAERIADDILPVDAVGSAWPAFPQLKLDAGQWWPRARGGLPLRAVLVLERGDCVQSVALDAQAALRALIANTAGARAFPPAVLESHLAHCVMLAQQVPVHRLQVPERAHDPESAALEAYAAVQDLR